MHCGSDNDCNITNQYCDETKHCVDKKKENEACTNNTECLRGICEDNVCKKEKENLSSLEKFFIGTGK